MVIRVPHGPVTPHGSYQIIKGDHPMVKLRAYDGSIEIHLMGGSSIPDPTMPESVQIVRDGLKGLIPPWQIITQKGATQDGSTFVDSLYDPAEIELTVMVRGRDPKFTRQTLRCLIAAIDAKQTSELSWITPDLGKWWADVRWFKTPADTFSGAQQRRQRISLRLTADDALWRSYDDVAAFDFAYEDFTDTFDYTTTSELGAGWTVAYSGTGGGFVRADGSQAVWVDDPAHPILTGGRTAVFRKNSFTTDTDNQVVETVLGSFPEWSFPENAENDLWARMKNTGTPGTDGVRLRFGVDTVRLSYFVAGVETVLREYLSIIPPFPGEKFSLIAGYEGDPRLFKVQRGGVTVMSVKEVGAGSQIGSGFRSVGGGMRAAAAVLTQATPAAMRKINAGDNSTVSQSGFVQRFNVGDQPRWDRFTLFGPGLFKLGDGPGSADHVEYGPLLGNQVVQIRTDPRKRGVVDLSSAPPTPQDLNLFQQALKDFISFATANNVPPLLTELESLFGIAPPQGNLYSLMKGRFSRPVPARSPGDPVKPQYVSVSIDDGNADSRVIAAGTPLRRMPY